MKRSEAVGIWWIFGLVPVAILLLLLVACCLAPFTLGSS